MDPGALEVAMEFGDLELRVDTRMDSTANLSVSGTSFHTPVFSTPLSLSASQADRDDRGGNESKVGLLLVNASTDFCGGVVGGRAKGVASMMWCTKLKGECRTKIHMSNKVAIESYRYYVKGGSGDKAFYIPSLDTRTAGIPAGVRLELGRRFETPVEWSRLFRAWTERDQTLLPFASSEGSSPSNWEDLGDVEEEEKNAAEDDLIFGQRSSESSPPDISSTPMSTNLRTEFEELEELDPAPEEVEVVTDEIRAAWIDTIVWNWNKGRDNLQGMIGIVDDNKTEARLRIDEVAKELLRLSDALGIRPGSETETMDFSLPKTVWETLGMLTKDSRRMGSAMNNMEATQGDSAQNYDSLKLRQERDKKELAVIRESLTNLVSSYRGTVAVLKSVMDKQARAGASENQPQRWNGGLGWAHDQGYGAPPVVNPSTVNLEITVQQMKDQLGRLQDEASQVRQMIEAQQLGTAGRNFGGMDAWSGLNSRGQQEQAVVDETTAHAISLLESRMSHIEGHRGDIVFEANGYRFASQNEVKRWIEAEHVESCGVHWDLLVCL
jgi:hypothetical protein